MVNETLQHLKEMGCKLTPQRRMLVEALHQAGGEGSTADELYQGVRATYPEVGLDTVYRNLRLFVKLNVAEEVRLSGKPAAYFLNRRAHHHGLVCLECGKEVPLQHCPIKELETVALEEHGFTISSHRIELFGYCMDCSERAETK